MMLLFVLAMSVNTAWGQLAVPPTDWHYVNFTTGVSTPSCGNTTPGQVKLNYTNTNREQDNPRISGPEPTLPAEYAGYEWAWDIGVSEGKSDAETQDTYDADYATREWGWNGEEETILKGNAAASAGYKAGFDWYKAGHWLNSFTGDDKNDYATGWGTSASLNGYAMIHMADMDSMPLIGSSYAYFEAKVKENDGWYFTGWSYTEGESDLGGHVDTDTKEDKGYLFKIFPSDKQGWNNKSQVYAYATFKPVMVSDYKVTGLINGTGNSTTVIFDAVGERVFASDFKVSVPDANFSAEISSCDANKVTVTVTYSGDAAGEFRGNVTLASKSGCSQLTAAVYARVGGASDKEASLYDTKVLAENWVESGDLTALIAKASATQIVALNADYRKTLEVGNDVTIFTNGYSISLLEVTAGTVTFAYDKYNGGADAVSVTDGKLVLNGGTFGSLVVGASGEVEQNGATFTGAANNKGTLVTNEGLFNAGLTSSKTLTVNNGTFKGETAITISGGTAAINRGTIEGTACGLKVIAGTATVKKLAAIKGGTYSAQQTGGTLTIECGKFDGPLNGTIDFTSGYFKTNNYGISTAGLDEMLVSAGTEYNEGYRYFLGTAEAAVANGAGVCRIGNVSYTTLEEALAYANNKPNEEVVIFMTNNYTLPVGYYTLPAKATLVVPMSDTQAKINLTAPRLVYNDVNAAEANMYSSNIPFEFRRLTFAKGVNMDVFGKIELTSTQYQSNEAYTSQPVGAYGHLVMEEGSHMTLMDKTELRAWGFMTGKGETDARRGATVREMFQMGDWKGAMTSVAITGMVAGTGMEDIVKSAIGGADSGDFSDKKIFPVSQYFIQNVESPVKYHPGALLSTSAAVSEGIKGMSISMAATDIAIVGVSGEHTAIFLMDIAADAENTWVRKWYDAENDIQVYDINSGAHIGSMELDMGGVNLMGFSIPVKLNSAKFDLPITSNMKIHLLTGGMDFEQNTSLLPGAEVEVDKESTVSISMNEEDKVAKAAGTANHVYHSGAVYVYDQAEWDTYAYDQSGQKYTKVVRYTPGAKGQPTKRTEGSKPASAKINVHGTFNTKDGYVYTSATGANIFSSNEDAGTFIFNNAASEAGERAVYQINGKGNRNADYKSTTFTCAKLKNGNNTYTETAGAIQGVAFIYRDGAWQMPMIQTANDMIVTYNSNCFTADVSMMTYLNLVCNVDNSSQQAMLASPMKEDVKNQVAIVHAPDNIAEFLAAKPLAAQLAPGEEMTAQGYEWMKRSDAIYQGNITYKQAFAMYKDQIQASANAIKEAGYDFGAAVQKVYIKPQEWLESAGTVHLLLGIDDVSYYEDLYNDGIKIGLSTGNYSQCTQAVNEYLEYIEANKLNPYIEGVEGNADHTFSDADGAGRLFILMDNCQWWEVEKKDNLYHCIHPDNDTYYYWDEDEGGWVEKKFTITWINWDKTPVITKDMDGNDATSYDVTYGTVAEFLGTNPTRPENIDYTYDFTGWQPELGPVTSDVTYTATFTQKPRMYTIIFQNEGGVEIERQFLTHNEVPVCENVPTKVGHTLVWEPAIAAVTGDATYRATWLEEPPTEYEIRFVDYDGSTELKKGNVAAGTMPTPPANPSGKPETSEFSYVFDHWSPALSKVTQAMTYTAVYSEVARTYTISYYNEEGSTVVSTEELPYGATPTPPVVTKENPKTGHTYTLVWKNLDETGTIQTVQGAASYKPTYLDVLNKYTVTVKSNPSGACSSTGAGLYDYNTSATLTLSVNAGYTFYGWSDGLEGTYTTRTITVTEDKELVANFIVADPDYTITWKNEAGTADLVAPVGQKAGTATIYPGATPTKDATAQYTYTFDGWATEANGPKVYKNGLTPVASGDATYYAHFSSTVNTYKVTLTSNPAGVCTFTGAGTYEYGADVAIDVASYNTTNYTFTGWSASVPTTVEGDINLTANFLPRTYTITWKSEDGSATLETDARQAYGAATAFNAAEPSKAGGVFAGWTTAANGEGSFYTNGSTPAVTGDATYFAYFNAVPQETLTAGVGDVVAAEAKAYASITITSNGTSSGQITNADALTSCGDAYFELKPNEDFDALTWYAVAVPWKVDATNGIIVNGSPLRLVTDIDVLYYDGASRADNGTGTGISNWKYVADLDDKTLNPGTLYMIYLANPTSSIRFKKKAGADISTTELSVQQHTSKTGSDIDAGWNGIANPALYHAFINAGASTVIPGEGATQHPHYAQKYVPGADSYVSFVMEKNPLIVGAPIFVQVAIDKPNVVACTTWSEAAANAPRRRAPRVDNAYYEVQISAGEDYTDRLYLQTMEDKEDRYVIGLDLAKAGVSTKVAQMWVNRYNAKLCVNTTAPVGKTATYPLGISIPENGTYQISSATEMQNNQELYVTRNGKAIWNLAYGPYTVTLDKGTYSEYGIKLIQSNAPAVTTGVDQTTNDKQQIQKVVIDNHVYIVREGELYTITGQKIK